jgi:methanogenic corrinoid protein MtbC1
VVEAALALDARRFGAALDDAFATLGSDRAVADVIVPAEIRIGDLWEAGECSIASEHLASTRFLHRLGRLLESAQPVSPAAPRVIAACFPDEHHQLGLLIVAWRLARHGVRVEYLGAAMPLDDLARVCRANRPRALLLSVMRRPLFDRQRRALGRLLADSADRVYVGGQGVPAQVRGGARRVHFIHERDEADAVRRIVTDLGLR